MKVHGGNKEIWIIRIPRRRIQSLTFSLAEYKNLPTLVFEPGG